MIEQAIEKILTLAPGAKEGRVPELDSRHTRFYREHGGALLNFQVQPPRRHVAANIRDFAQAIETFKGDGGGSTPDVFIGVDAVRCNLDTNDRLDTITLPLIHSEAFVALDTLRDEDNHDQSQRDFCRLLDTTLSGVLNEKVHTVCKSVTVDTRGTVRSAIAQGKRSMGQDIDKEVGQAIEIPEQVEARLPVYSNLDLRNYLTTAKCRLIVTPEIQFTLFMTSEERQRIIDETLEYLHGSLAKAGLPKDRLFIGTP